MDRQGTCIILDKKYNIENSSCHFWSYGSIWTGPSPIKYYMDLRSFGPYNILLVTDRSIYCHMTLSAMNYLLYKSTSLLTIWLIIYFTKKNMWLIIYCTQNKHVVGYLLHSKPFGWLILNVIWGILLWSLFKLVSDVSLPLANYFFSNSPCIPTFYLYLHNNGLGKHVM
jgi:hypothetical protein